jgi:hypothetical protein
VRNGHLQLLKLGRINVRVNRNERELNTSLRGEARTDGSDPNEIVACDRSGLFTMGRDRSACCGHSQSSTTDLAVYETESVTKRTS